MKLDRLANSAVTAIKKQERRDIPYDQVPIELLCDPQLDLSQWSLVVTDACLKKVKVAHKICNVSSSNLTLLNLSGAQQITDVGLESISLRCFHLKTLYLDNAYSITGTGLAAITKQCCHLQHLSLAGTINISGASFSIIGQQCREIITLNLSCNKQITPWAFMKIFEGCKLLKHLDISFCSLITDDQIKLLAECVDLRTLNLRECKQISDVGLTYLSQGCGLLAELILRRSELPFRCTDVALLQIAQGSKHLTCLNVSGCEMLSDTGLSWLANWTKALRHLDLSNCNKITNKGIRHIGEGE